MAEETVFQVWKGLGASFCVRCHEIDLNIPKRFVSANLPLGNTLELEKVTCGGSVCPNDDNGMEKRLEPGRKVYSTVTTVGKECGPK